MKRHVKLYMDHFGYDQSDFIPCECGCGQKAVDIHHIESRGMGGRQSADTIDNLIALSRDCHTKAHGPLSRWYKEIFKVKVMDRSEFGTKGKTSRGFKTQK